VVLTRGTRIGPARTTARHDDGGRRGDGRPHPGDAPERAESSTEEREQDRRLVGDDDTEHDDREDGQHCGRACHVPPPRVRPHATRADRAVTTEAIMAADQPRRRFGTAARRPLRARERGPGYRR